MNTDGMVQIPAGDFVMGSKFGYPEERPQKTLQNDAIWMDQLAVTNAEFGAFVAATGYVTTCEQSPDPADFPDMPDAFFQPGSLVFHMTDGPVALHDPSAWWRFIKGACWDHPEGPQSDILGRETHPVVHVSLLDAKAFATWAGKSIPTEAQWEAAARAGSAQEYPWGKTFDPEHDNRANTWIGEFPWQNKRSNTPPFSLPVDAFEPNAFGLKNMLGNVWEWTRSEFLAPHSQSPCCSPAQDGDTQTMYTLKGGSFLCAPSYCQRYRPAARIPQDKFATTNHAGFRCVGVS